MTVSPPHRLIGAMGVRIIAAFPEGEVAITNFSDVGEEEDAEEMGRGVGNLGR